MYTEARVLAKSDLKTVHPTYLCLMLNFSVFYWEIVKDRDSACTLAKETFEEAMTNIDFIEAE